MANRKMKEYYTITLDGIPVGALSGFLHETLGICGAAVERSHFYAAGAGDFTYSDALDMKQKGAVPGDPIPDDVVRVKNDIWLGDTSNIEFEGEPVPAYLETKDGITLISNRPITLYEIGSMINKITSLSVRYAPELEETAIENADNNQPSMKDLGAQWTDSTRMIVNYKGPISGLLDEVANRFGIWWKYEKNQFYFYKYVTKTFTIYTLPTNPSVSVSVGGSGGASSISQSSSIDGMDL